MGSLKVWWGKLGSLVGEAGKFGGKLPPLPCFSMYAAIVCNGPSSKGQRDVDVQSNRDC